MKLQCEANNYSAESSGWQTNSRYAINVSSKSTARQLEHWELKFRKNCSGQFNFAKCRNESFLRNILGKFSPRPFLVRENAKTRPFFIPRLVEWEGNGNELYFRDVTVVWTNLRSVELLSFFCSCWLRLCFFFSLSLSLASFKKPSVCYVPRWGFAHIQRWARFPKIVKLKVQKALGFPNRVFQSCHPQPNLRSTSLSRWLLCRLGSTPSYFWSDFSW